MNGTTVSPCPFCSRRDVRVIEVDGNAWAIVCAACGSIGPMGSNEEDARRRWNLRLATPSSDLSEPP
jgi:hypothetical protein